MKKLEEVVTVARLKDLYHSGEYDIEIDTPDGYQKITEWFDKGELPMVKIGTATNQTYCATNHLIQRDSGEWVPAGELSVGDMVITTSGVEEVDSKEIAGSEACFDFTVDHPNHRYWGDGFSSHNSGKSYIASGNIVKAAQEQGIFVILIDSENALDLAWLAALGVDTDESKLLKLSMAMIDDVAKTISTFMADYRELAEEERPKVLFVIDSLGMLLTPTDVDQFGKGDLKGDLGRKPKALTALVRNCVNMFGSYNVGLVATNHTYASQDMFDPDDKISGGCLTAGHKVRMANGATKNIEDIQVGDSVVTMNGTKDVAKTFNFDDKEVFEIELDNGAIIQATGEHKFLVEVDGEMVWKKVAELSEDDEILAVD